MYFCNVKPTRSATRHIRVPLCDQSVGKNCVLPNSNPFWIVVQLSHANLDSRNIVRNVQNPCVMFEASRLL